MTMRGFWRGIEPAEDLHEAVGGEGDAARGRTAVGDVQEDGAAQPGRARRVVGDDGAVVVGRAHVHGLGLVPGRLLGEVDPRVVPGAGGIVVPDDRPAHPPERELHPGVGGHTEEEVEPVDPRGRAPVALALLLRWGHAAGADVRRPRPERRPPAPALPLIGGEGGGRGPVPGRVDHHRLPGGADPGQRRVRERRRGGGAAGAAASSWWTGRRRGRLAGGGGSGLVVDGDGVAVRAASWPAGRPPEVRTPPQPAKEITATISATAARPHERPTTHYFTKSWGRFGRRDI